MAKYKAIQSPYWRPGSDYCKIITTLIKPVVRDGDIIVVSEKALAIAKGNLVNEDQLTPSLTALFLVKVWIRIMWGFFLHHLCRFKPPTIMRLRHYPIMNGSHHKQTVIMYRGLIHALHYGSEGGIDLNNVPYAFACIPLADPQKEAQHIFEYFQVNSETQFTLLISDTDSTFSWKNIHFTSRPKAIDGIFALNNPIAFILGRFLKLKQRATPLAKVGKEISVEDALRFSEIAHRARGQGAGRTIWDSAKEFRVDLSDITWKHLDLINHYPLVVIRIKRNNRVQKRSSSSNSKSHEMIEHV